MDILKSYTGFDFLGSGCFGDVFKGSRDGGTQAVKIILTEATDAKGIKYATREVDAFKMISGKNHRNIVQPNRWWILDIVAEDLRLFISDVKKTVNLSRSSMWLDSFTTIQQSVKMYVIDMELCGKKTLNDWVIEHSKRGADPKIQMEIVKDILRGLAFLHECEIIHRDLKPDNMLFKLGNEEFCLPLKLADFGYGIIRGSGAQALTKCIGNRLYMSPEVGKGEDYDFKADVYSAGLIIWEVLQLMGEKERGGLFLALELAESVADRRTVMREEIPLRMKNVILKMTERNTTRRTSTIQEVLAEVDSDDFPPLQTISLQTKDYLNPDEQNSQTANDDAYCQNTMPIVKDGEQLPVTHPHVVDCFLQDSYYLENWKAFADRISISRMDVFAATICFLTGGSGMYEITQSMFQLWVRINRTEATLEKLIRILKDDYTALCDTLEQLLKYPNNPPDFKQSVSRLQDDWRCPSMDLRNLQIERRLDCDVYSDMYKVYCALYSSAILKRISIGRYKKTMENKPDSLRFFHRLMREVRIMVKLNHRNIAGYYDGWFVGPLEKQFMDWIATDESSFPSGIDQVEGPATEAEMSTYLFIKMEYMHSNIARYVHSRSKETSQKDIRSTSKFAVVEILKGLEFMHSQDFIHRDLHPVNILLNFAEDGSGKIKSVKIGNFGSSRKLEQDTRAITMETWGTAFASPEIQRGENYNFKTDIFSVGAIWVFMTHQFETMQMFERTMGRISRGDVGIFGQLSHDGQTEAKLVSRMLDRNPDNRPTAGDAWMEW